MRQATGVVERIQSFNRGRDPERLLLKYKAMHKDALGFFRGTCHLYSEDWPISSRLNETPSVWVCGDLHIENFGAYRGDNRLVYFDIADFDESILAPCAWDLTRLATSVLLAGKNNGLKRKERLSLCNVFLDTYALALSDGKARWIERTVAQGLIGSLLRKVEGRSQRVFLEKRTESRSGKTKLRIDHKHTLVAADDDRNRVKSFMHDFAEEHPYRRFFKPLDVARRIAGTGSLGLERYTVLVEGWGRGGHVLLDLKFSSQSALAGAVKQQQPHWTSEAERVVAMQRRVQAISPAFLDAVSMGGKSYILRELMPTEDKIDLKAWKDASDRLVTLAGDLGCLVAWGELRCSGRDGSATTDELIEFAHHKKWRRSAIDYAEHYEDVAWDDWKQFREAYRSGVFKVLSEGWRAAAP